MSALPITITTAGLQALINAQNTGVSNVVIDKLGVSSQFVAVTAATTAIPAEIKRLSGVSGLVTAEDTIYVSAADQSQDTYTVRTVALYLTDGTLFAAYSQAAPLVEKASPSQAVLEASIKLLAPMAEVIEFTGGGWVNPPASEAVAGILLLASVDEAVAGVNHSKAVTPKGLKAVVNAMMASVQAALDALGTALAGKSNLGHQHAAGDVTSGTFNEARIPELPQSRIAGLIAALGEKASALHGHTMDQIAGLAAALASKANVQHTHNADDVNSGVFNVGRIPALAMEKITGLAAALATKATLGVNNVFRDVIAGRDASTGVYYFGTDAGRWLAFSAGQFELVGSSALTVGGYTVWTSLNFNPSSKANIYAPVFGGLITTPNVAIKSDASTWRSLKFFSGEAERHGLMMDTQPEDAATNAGGNLLYYAVLHDGTVRNIWQGERASGRLRFFNTPHVNGSDIFHAGAVANAAQYRANTGAVPVVPATVWSAAEVQTITQAATLAVNLATGLNFTTVMTGNRTLGAPANAKPGQSGVIQFVQDGSGGRTLAFDPAWKFASGLVPQLSTAANARDVLVFTVIAPGDVVASLMKDVRR